MCLHAKCTRFTSKRYRLLILRSERSNRQSRRRHLCPVWQIARLLPGDEMICADFLECPYGRQQAGSPPALADPLLRIPPCRSAGDLLVGRRGQGSVMSRPSRRHHSRPKKSADTARPRSVRSATPANSSARSLRCQIRGRMRDLQVDHTRFRSHSGPDSEENLITLCARRPEEIHQNKH